MYFLDHPSSAVSPSAGLLQTFVKYLSTEEIENRLKLLFSTQNAVVNNSKKHKFEKVIDYMYQINYDLMTKFRKGGQ